MDNPCGLDGGLCLATVGNTRKAFKEGKKYSMLP